MSSNDERSCPFTLPKNADYDLYKSRSRVSTRLFCLNLDFIMATNAMIATTSTVSKASVHPPNHSVYSIEARNRMEHVLPQGT